MLLLEVGMRSWCEVYKKYCENLGRSNYVSNEFEGGETVVNICKNSC